MKSIAEVQKRALTAFDRNWREWAACLLADEPCMPRLSVNLQPPREKDLATTSDVTRARDWVALWRSCPLSGVEWQTRSWSRVGDQTVPVRVRLEGVDEITRWAGQAILWNTALGRLADVRGLLSDARRPVNMSALKDAVRSSLNSWCSLGNGDWDTALLVWDWLFAHDGSGCYVRQLPIRGIDTKWIQQHGRALRDLHIAVAGGDFSFRQPAKLFRCKACDPAVALAGCDEFALSAQQLSRTPMRAERVIICENLVNTLSLSELTGTLAIHGAGFAVTELRDVSWLADVPVLYWGDLDSNGFAILNALRSFAPHAESVMMDRKTLLRYFDLCVDEPSPATGTFPNLTGDEASTLEALAHGDPMRGIANLRLEQERIEWDWAKEQVEKALQ